MDAGDERLVHRLAPDDYPTNQDPADRQTLQEKDRG